MANKAESRINEIKKLLGTKKLIIGTERTIKKLKQGGIARVYLAANTSEKIKGDIQYYCGLGGVEFELLSKSNEDLGAFCKKQFKISVLSVAKE